MGRIPSCFRLIRPPTASNPIDPNRTQPRADALRTASLVSQRPVSTIHWIDGVKTPRPVSPASSARTEIQTTVSTDRTRNARYVERSHHGQGGAGTVGSGQLAVGSWQWALGGWRLAVGSWRYSAFRIPHSASCTLHTSRRPLTSGNCYAIRAYFAWPSLKRSPPYMSYTTTAGKSSTTRRRTASAPRSSYAMISACLMRLAISAPAPPIALR